MRHPSRTLPFLAFSLFLVACDDEVEPDDTSPVEDTVVPDECDDTPGQVRCIDGQAVTCDEVGDVASRETCDEGWECTEGKGCTKIPDECDETPQQILCLEGEAVTCDEEGDVVSRVTCEAGSVCIVDVGCATCAVDVADELLGEPQEEVPGASVVAAMAVGPLALTRMRALTISSTTPGATVTVEATGVSLYDTDGFSLPSPYAFPPGDLPATVLVGGDVVAEGSVTATLHLDGCDALTDTVAVHVVEWAGLSGVPRLDFPWFSWVDAFNATGPAYVAFDASWFPDRVGMTADVYVVEHRSASAWVLDPTLADVTGKVETLVVAGDSVASNVVQVWTSIDPAGLVARPLDVVLDFDGDGAYGPGDFLDGGDTVGLEAVKDLSTPGPHEVVESTYSGGTWLGQDLYYPEDIATLGELPLVVVSHGNGHDYTWYDYLGEHLASHGYVVMAHQNNTGPGIQTASTTTLTNTDYILGHLDTIEDGALLGHVDGHRIVWIGHSRGGEGVVRAYDRLVEGDYEVDEFTPDDIVLISSIAPTVFYSVSDSDPHDRPYHLIAGAADGDVTGGPDCTQCQFFRLAQAATGDTHVTYVQGASHNDFNCCGFDDGTGPDLIGRTEAQTVAKSTWLALLEARLQGDEALLEYVSRMYDDLHASGISDDTVVVNQYRVDRSGAAIVLDGFQVETDASVSDCGGAVSYDGTGLREGKLDDRDSYLVWSDSDPVNGMTQAADDEDLSRGAVFGWSEGSGTALSFEVPEGYGDWTGFRFLSFRAAQQTRHANTVALDGPLSFTVTLVDGAGVESSIDFGVMGGLTQPYLRSGLGAGYGWANEFATVRLRLVEFRADDTDLDLTDIVEVRFDVGEGAGSLLGRIGVDDLEIVP
jgi:hypothetical protein